MLNFDRWRVIGVRGGRVRILKWFLVFLFLTRLWAVGSARSAESRPNILWITAEDMSANLGCYGDRFATTPHIDAFAKQAVRYTRTFATAPVCSPSRSCLVTGLYATSLGTQRLRSEFRVPGFVRGFPALLREAGYFTSNNVKTDYNMAGEQAFIRRNWDRNSGTAHWRDRGDGRPFFSVFNLMTTHQSRSSVWSREEFVKKVQGALDPGERHDPALVSLPPYYPDTPEVRRSVARYYDCISVMDKQVGELLGQLDRDGLAEDTIVFFYSDHGMGMPRGKRVLHDSGMHVPLIVRFPARFAGHAPAAAGGTEGRLVSFVDFAPTVLSLAGVPIPDFMQGTPFLGAQRGPAREFVFGARDRVDEVFDLSRSVRDDRYLYIRNFMPHLSWMPPERYSDQSVMRREMRRMAREGNLNPAQSTYAAGSRSVEEFYDTVRDPHQVHNLAGAPGHDATIERYRRALEQWIIRTCDLGFLPEPMVWDRVNGGAPWDLRHNPDRYDLRTIFAAASAGTGRVRRESVDGWIRHDDPAVRYWGAMGSRSLDARAALRELTRDPSPTVRIEAAAALAARGDANAVRVLVAALASDSPDTILRAMRGLELAGDNALPVVSEIEDVRDRAAASEGHHPNWMFVRFSAEAALESLRPNSDVAE